MQTTVADRIKSLRIQRGWTQEQLGELLGVTKAAIQKYETGQIKNFKSESIKTMCELFEVSPVYFIFDNVPDYYAKEPIELLKAHFGTWFVDFMSNFNDLNQHGKTKVISYCEDLASIGRLRNDGGQKEEPSK